jgi:hypothetical protein
MFGPSSTAARIDAFESRFAMANGAHFPIAANGKEARPISEAEWIAFRELYRGRIVPLLILAPCSSPPRPDRPQHGQERGQGEEQGEPAICDDRTVLVDHALLRVEEAAFLVIGQSRAPATEVREQQGQR